MSARFIQIHTLTHYPASLLNRDDAGFAKRMPFGGAVRTRISSQCLKRHWREYAGEHSLGSIGAPESIRSRVAFERFVVQPLVESGVDQPTARAAVRALVDELLGSADKKERTPAPKKGKAGEAKADGEKPVDGEVVTPQVTVLGRPELEYLRQLAADAIRSGPSDGAEKRIRALLKDKALKQNLRALHPGSLEAGLGAALFGRMVTGDILSRSDAAVHVAHAMTVHAHMSEGDYFSAIDDLIRDEGEQESGHINSSELTSGLFYGYIVIDVDGLVSNLGGDRSLAGEVVERFVRFVPVVSPGAKKGSTAPYAYSHLVLVESGCAQPRTLQNAFIEPVPSTGNVVERAYEAVRRHLADLDEMYGKSETRAHAGLGTGERFESRMTLAELASWTKAQVA